jgi:hypothetical protein
MKKLRCRKTGKMEWANKKKKEGEFRCTKCGETVSQ